jgi:DNA-directed RNA polymerase subunit alpha
MAKTPIYCPHCRQIVATIYSIEKTEQNIEYPQEILNKPVADIEFKILATRIKNVLRIEKVKKIGDLITLSEAELMRTPNLGKKSIAEIKQRLAEFGLELAEYHY